MTVQRLAGSALLLVGVFLVTQRRGGKRKRYVSR